MICALFMECSGFQIEPQAGRNWMLAELKCGVPPQVKGVLFPMAFIQEHPSRATATGEGATEAACEAPKIRRNSRSQTV